MTIGYRMGRWLCRRFGHKWIYSRGEWLEYRACTRCQWRYCESRLLYLEIEDEDYTYDPDASIE